MASWSLSFLLGKTEFRVPTLIASQCFRGPQPGYPAGRPWRGLPAAEVGSAEGKNCFGHRVPHCCRVSPSASRLSLRCVSFCPSSGPHDPCPCPPGVGQPDQVAAMGAVLGTLLGSPRRLVLRTRQRQRGRAVLRVTWPGRGRCG